MPEYGQMTRRLADSLKNTKIEPRDHAAVALALEYAQLMDSADEENKQKVYSDLGPKFLAVLAALKMTPAARSVGGVPKGGVIPNAGNSAADALGALRAERGAASRANRATVIHTSAA